MSIFIDPTGHTNLGIGICARCSEKFPLDELSPDRNSPGLMVCRADNDELDPYRLPPRQPDNIILPFYRPDTPLEVPDSVDSRVGLRTEDPDVGVETESTGYGIEVQE